MRQDVVVDETLLVASASGARSAIWRPSATASSIAAPFGATRFASPT
jgi:hypothetical protein